MTRRLAVLALVVALAGCGVPAEDRARVVDPPVATGSPAPRATGGSAGAATVRLFLVRGDRLVAVERGAAAEPGAERQLADLVAGPTDAERAAGFTSALAGTDLVDGVKVEDGTARVTLRPQAEFVGRTDDVLAVGQIVCTLDARDDIDTVQFLRDGAVLRVPRADGFLTDLPLTVTDYTPLIGP